MILSDYYRILGLDDDASEDDIKRAYRRKARTFHPDLNHSPEACDQFILATEAYEFLMTNRSINHSDSETFNRVMDDWKRRRQEEARRRARAYSRTSYVRFRSTKFYRTTRILDGTSIISSLIVSVAVIAYTITGYIYRLIHPLPDKDNPTVFSFIMLLFLGLVFFAISLIYLKAYIESSRKKKK